MSHVWVKHRDHGGYWQCPDEAVDAYKDLGWELSDPPEEVNPVIAERLAWEAQQAAQAEPTRKTKNAPQEG